MSNRPLPIIPSQPSQNTPTTVANSLPVAPVEVKSPTVSRRLPNIPKTATPSNNPSPTPPTRNLPSTNTDNTTKNSNPRGGNRGRGTPATRARRGGAGGVSPQTTSPLPTVAKKPTNTPNPPQTPVNRYQIKSRALTANVTNPPPPKRNIAYTSPIVRSASSDVNERSKERDKFQKTKGAASESDLLIQTKTTSNYPLRGEQLILKNGDLSNIKLRSSQSITVTQDFAQEKLKLSSSYPNRTGTHSFISPNGPYKVSLLLICLFNIFELIYFCFSFIIECY